MNKLAYNPEMDHWIEMYIDTLPKGMKDIEVARTFNYLHAFCQWYQNTYRCFPDRDIFVNDTSYRSIRAEFIIESKKNFAFISHPEKTKIPYDVRNVFATLVAVDLFAEWMRAYYKKLAEQAAE